MPDNLTTERKSQEEKRQLYDGAMVLHGFRPQTHDIDLGCSTFWADRLEQQGYSVLYCDDGNRRIAYSEDIEIFENWLEGTAEIISGVPVVSVDGLIQMKQKLGRGKDLEDIALIRSKKTSLQRGEKFGSKLPKY